MIPATRTGDVHHVFVKGAAPGLDVRLQGLGAVGPGPGHRFNEAKLLLDPYARAVSRRPHDRDGLLCAYDHGRDDRAADGRDSAPVAPRSLVVDTAFDWQGDRPPGSPARTC